ncbi:hypothetical protein ADN00_16550 [Ornatilinea apprima]|uniref:DUF4956 domain-containing protein n=1 Tax=Ornatilinea apprima TaxID=1134406 RepID=A0A0N8GLC1_9CHLR|nr:DUF4956 domain-containing protein [Ornatilinea apprima]KPL72082.1 hypothetical protein ADN00_16550 [Ornatilinea apprima]
MDTTVTPPLSLPALLLNLAIGVGLSLVVSWYYVKFGNSLSNRSKFAPILPILTLITLLTITIVKSSLALSLGLVGALSIVRFRTAIKDPEELIFLFFAIAIGLGLGADQRIPTVVSATVILLYLLVRALITRKHNASHSLYLNIQLNTAGGEPATFSQVNQLLAKELKELDLRRLDQSNGNLQITYYLNIQDQDTLVRIMDSLKTAYPESSVSLIEQNNLLGG